MADLKTLIEEADDLDPENVNLDRGEIVTGVPRADAEALGIVDSSIRHECHRCGEEVLGTAYISHLNDHRE